MAEEEFEDGFEGEEGQEEGEGKKGKLKLIIILVVALVVLGGGGFAAYKFFLASPEEPALSEEGETLGETGEGASAEDEGAAEGEGGIYPLDPFIVNLSDPVGNRYLKIKVALQLDSGLLQAEVETKIPQIRDGFLILLSSKSLSQINTTEGKLKLRSELLHRVNQVLKKGRVTTLYFTEFVVQ